jgi:PAS domain S-box-containing protein
VVVIDARARILHVSGRAFEAHGLSTEGWIGASAEEVFPAEALPTLRHRFQAALGGAPQSFSYRSVDTGRVYVVQLVPVPDATGSIASVVASMQDATEHLRMTAELERSEGRLREAECMVGVGSWELVLASGEITYSAGLAAAPGARARPAPGHARPHGARAPRRPRVRRGDPRAVRPPGVDER